jgi:hypothetical protein
VVVVVGAHDVCTGAWLSTLSDDGGHGRTCAVQIVGDESNVSPAQSLNTFSRFIGDNSPVSQCGEDFNA